jgi:hypothetical protein
MKSLLWGLTLADMWIRIAIEIHMKRSFYANGANDAG